MAAILCFIHRTIFTCFRAKNRHLYLSQYTEEMLSYISFLVIYSPKKDNHCILVAEIACLKRIIALQSMAYLYRSFLRPK